MAVSNEVNLMDKIVSLCKRRGFIFPACEIYGGFANSYSYGPYGLALKRNIINLWRQRFVSGRNDIYEIDGPILLHPKLWEASGHLSGFNDALVDCKNCQKRFRADVLIADTSGQDLEGDLEAINKLLMTGQINCPECKKSQWTEARTMNLMFKTNMNGINDDVYLRPETAGAIFMEFNNIVDTMRPKLPFGIAQVGKAFRNEIITGNFIFRVREFEQLEIEYFFDPQADWEKIFDHFLQEQEAFTYDLGVKPANLRRYQHPQEKLSHYSQKTVDLEFNFPFGFKELFGLAHRSDFDLKSHAKASGKKIEFFEEKTKRRFIPQVIEPTFGLDRAILATLTAAYQEEPLAEDNRVVLKLPTNLAPVKIAVFPLLKNKPDLITKAKAVYQQLQTKYICEFDDNGNIGKRYRRQDEIGTPFCLTIDFTSLEDDTVTIRDRDLMKQTRVKIGDLLDFFTENLK